MNETLLAAKNLYTVQHTNLYEACLLEWKKMIIHNIHGTVTENYKSKKTVFCDYIIVVSIMLVVQSISVPTDGGLSQG